MTVIIPHYIQKLITPKMSQSVCTPVALIVTLTSGVSVNKGVFKARQHCQRVSVTA